MRSSENESSMSKAQETKFDWPALALLFVGVPLAFTYGGIWVGLLILVVGIIALGWRKRHEGPLPTSKRD